MENYTRAPKERSDAPIQENEIRIVASNQMKSYISYALTLLQEKGHASIILKAMGRAINKTVAIAEVIKRRIEGLHQLTEMSSTDITDVWEPTEPGLTKLEIVRHVSCITITLSSAPLDTAHPGYQAPLPADQVTAAGGEDVADPLVTELEARGEGSRDRRRGGGRPRRGRGGGGGGGGGGGAAAAANGGAAAGGEAPQGEAGAAVAAAGAGAGDAAQEGEGGGRGRGRSRGGRGGRGRGRGRGGRGRGRGRGGRGGQPAEEGGGGGGGQPASELGI